MAHQPIAVILPEPIYGEIEHWAREQNRTVEDQLVGMVVATLPTVHDLPADIADDMAQLAFLTDEELQQASTLTIASQVNERMKALLSKQQREGLTTEEQQEAESLLDSYDRTMLIRAQAAVLLKGRGYALPNLISSYNE